jgi:hypothetical protein
MGCHEISPLRLRQIWSFFYQSAIWRAATFVGVLEPLVMWRISINRIMLGNCERLFATPQQCWRSGGSGTHRLDHSPAANNPFGNRLIIKPKRRSYLVRAGRQASGLIPPVRQGDTTMLTKSKIALSLALVLGMASAAAAATKHPIHHHQGAVVERVAPAGTAYGYAAPSHVRQPNSGSGIGNNFLSSGCGTVGC